VLLSGNMFEIAGQILRKYGTENSMFLATDTEDTYKRRTTKKTNNGDIIQTEHV